MSASAAERVAELRRTFDATFALPPARPAAESAFLAIRVGREACALRIEDVRGLLADKRIVPVPSAVRALLGLVGIRGTIVPAYSLAALLGDAPAGGLPRWLVLAGASEPIALAFEEFEGYVSVPRGEVYSATLDATPNQAGHWVADVVHGAGVTRAVIEVARLVETIER